MGISGAASLGIGKEALGWRMAQGWEIHREASSSPRVALRATPLEAAVGESQEGK